MRWIIYFLGTNRRFVALAGALMLSMSLFLMGDGSKEHIARAVTTAIFTTGRFTFSWAIHLSDLWHENSRLRRQNLEYAYEIQTNRLAAGENEHLRRMLGFREKYPYEVISALVIGQDVDRAVNALIVDRGSRDGVRKYMAVVTDQGLIGRVFEVYPTASSVQIIRDMNSRISAMIEGERDIMGIVRWEGGDDLRLYTLEQQSSFTSGQQVYTTGLGGTYPEGLLIGHIVTAPESGARVLDSVEVRPAADFSHTHEVFILSGSERGDIWDDGDGGGYFERPQLQ